MVFEKLLLPLATALAILLIAVLHLTGRTELLKADEFRDMYSSSVANFRVLRGLEIIEYK